MTLTINTEVEERIVNDNYITNIVDDDREVIRADLQGLRYGHWIKGGFEARGRDLIYVCKTSSKVLERGTFFNPKILRRRTFP